MHICHDGAGGGFKQEEHNVVKMVSFFFFLAADKFGKQISFVIYCTGLEYYKKPQMIRPL